MIERCLLIRAEEEIVGGVRHQGLLAHIAGDRATRRGSRSAIGVQALDKRGFGQLLTAGRPFRGTNDLQQEAVDRASIWAASVGPSSDEMLFLGPYPAAVEGTLPGYVSKAGRIWTDQVGIFDRA